jgi:hypothetical protein
MPLFGNPYSHSFGQAEILLMVFHRIGTGSKTTVSINTSLLYTVGCLRAQNASVIKHCFVLLETVLGKKQSC